MADIYFISQKTIGVRMSETATVSFRTDPKVKEEAKALYESMGMGSFHRPQRLPAPIHSRQRHAVQDHPRTTGEH